MFFEQNKRWAQSVMLRGSSIICVRRSRNTEVLQRVEIDVPLPDVARPLDVALGIGVEHVLHQFGREIVHVLDADDRVRAAAFHADLERAPGDVLGEISDPLEIARYPNRADDLAQVVRHRLPARDRQRRLLLDLALQRVEPGIGLHHLLRERRVAGGKRVDRVDHHLLGQAPISAIRRSSRSRSLS